MSLSPITSERVKTELVRLDAALAALKAKDDELTQAIEALKAKQAEFDTLTRHNASDIAILKMKTASITLPTMGGMVPPPQPAPVPVETEQRGKVKLSDIPATFAKPITAEFDEPLPAGIIKDETVTEAKYRKKKAALATSFRGGPDAIKAIKYYAWNIGTVPELITGVSPKRIFDEVRKELSQ